MLTAKVFAMANTKDFGRFFVQFVSLIETAPLFHTATAQAIEPPYRSSKVAIFRIPRTGWAIALGWWRDSGLNEEQALLAAMEAKGLDLYDVDLDDDSVRAAVRENIAAHSESWDEEWEIINMLGVVE